MRDDLECDIHGKVWDRKYATLHVSLSTPSYPDSLPRALHYCRLRRPNALYVFRTVCMTPRYGLKISPLVLTASALLLRLRRLPMKNDAIGR